MESYRIWWNYKKPGGTIRIYSNSTGTAMISQGNLTFTSSTEMRDFITLFLCCGAPVAFLPDSMELETGPFPVGQRQGVRP